MKDPFGPTNPERDSASASAYLGVEVELERPEINKEIAHEVNELLIARRAIDARLREITGCDETQEAVVAAKKLVSDYKNRPRIDWNTPRPTADYPDDRDPSVSIHASSAGLPSHGKKRR